MKRNIDVGLLIFRLTARGFTQVSRLRETQVRGQSRRAVLDV